MPYASDSYASGEGVDEAFRERRMVTVMVADQGSAELTLYDVNYVKVVESASPLQRRMAPGRYRLRIRVGDAAAFQMVDLAPDDAPLILTVAAPLQGQEAGLDGSSVNDETMRVHPYVHRLRQRTQTGVVVVLHGDGGHAPEHQQLVMQSLHLRCGAKRLRLHGGTGSEAHESGLAAGRAVKGRAVLCQRSGHRIRSLVIPVSPGYITQLRLPMPSLDGATAAAIDFGSATIVLLPDGEPSGADLRRQEAAYMALNRGRKVLGWSGELLSTDETAVRRAPMLALIDLVTRCQLPWTVENEAHGRALLRSVEACFTTQLADLDAVRLALGICRPDQKEHGAPPDPPLLAGSWRLLVEHCGGREAAQRYLPEGAVPDPAGPWLTWTALAAREPAQAGTPHAGATARRRGEALDRVIESVAGPEVGARKHLPVLTNEMFDKLVARVEIKAGGPAPQMLTYAQVNDLLVQLVRSNRLRSLLDTVYHLAEQSEYDIFRDPAALRFMGALDTLLDSFIVKTVGLEPLVRQLLDGLALPGDRIVSLFMSLIAVARASDWMNHPSLGGRRLDGVLEIAKEWSLLSLDAYLERKTNVDVLQEFLDAVRRRERE